jgi:uncharacterized ion transporter superfamily protein YfcC
MSSEQREHNAFVRWKHTTLGRVTWAIFTAVIAYAVASLAIDSGALWQWAVAILFTLDALYNLVQLARKLIQHDNHSNPDQA